MWKGKQPLTAKTIHIAADTKNMDDMVYLYISVKEVNRQLVAVFNFLVTVGGAFVFGFKATEYASGSNTFALVNYAFLSILLFNI